MVRVARSPEKRVLVWKRMNKQELLWLKSKQRERIEHLAELYNMPLHAPK